MFDRSLPYFNVLLKSSNNKRMSILRTFPSYVIDDLVEILYNIVLGKVDIGSKKRNLQKHKNALVKIANANTKTQKRKLIYKQTGGFLGALIPIIASVAGSLINSATGN